MESVNETPTFDVEPVADVLLAVLQEISLARPALQFPADVLTGFRTPINGWTEQLTREVYHEMVTTLRGIVEDLGYDPDLLPGPPALERCLELAEGGKEITISVPDIDENFKENIAEVPGQSWDGVNKLYRVPLTHPVVGPLRELVRGQHVKVSQTAILRLRELAEQISETPSLAAVATVTIADKGRVMVRFAVPSPKIADAFKRVSGFRWDGTVNAFLAPATRLREVLAIAKTLPNVYVPVETHKYAAENEAPLNYDGTLDGLRGVPVSDLNSVSGTKIEKFADFGIKTVLDLLMLIPRRYLDRSNLTLIRSLEEGQEVGLLATITKIDIDRARKMFKVTLADSTGKITATYFNAIWMASKYRVGDEVTVYGKVDAWKGSSRNILSLNNPIMDTVGDSTLSIIPMYPQSAKTRITTWEISSAVAEAMRRLGELVDPLPETFLTDLELMGRQEALKTIHAPSSLAAADKARTRLAFDELFRMQTALLLMKAAEETEVGIANHPTGVLTSELLDGLPYSLTGAQTRALEEIKENMLSPSPMHRLLQGDVGAGKTLMALASLLVAIESGYQGALMAPTEILATQLYTELVERSTGLTRADGTPLRIEFFSNKLRGKKREATIADLADGSIDIAVGTHALIVGDVEFRNLGLAVIDEQHRFGVEQRAVLRNKGPMVDVGGVQVQARPDMLVMTATPIPRTAAMTVFGDLDISVLDELPPGRTPIVTSWKNEEPNLQDPNENPWDLIRSEVTSGRQAYVVCPLVEDSEKMQAASAVETFESLQHGALHGLRLGLVHGQMPTDERTETMNAFRDGLIDVLVATTVIEVGVNVPNATVMVILNSNRFGIAQLHQLRGRVGRGKFASYCVLIGECVTSDARARMEALVASTDGFWLSEVDLKLRGHGQVFGASQSGQSDLRVADFDKDRDLLILAREKANELLLEDPGLRRRPALRSEIVAVLGPQAEEWLVKS